MGYSMRTNGWHFVRWVDRRHPTSAALALELYDLKNDPGEMRNLAGDGKHKRRIAALTKQMNAGWKAARPR